MRFSRANFWHRVVKHSDGCWGWTGFVDNKGYGRVNAWVGNKRQSQGAHRISWVIHNGDIPAGMHVLHSCDNPICTRPDHLRLGTHEDNMRDMAQRKRARGRCPPERAHAAKLNWEKAREIRQLKANIPSLSHDVIAAQYEVSRAAISLLLEGKTWRKPT